MIDKTIADEAAAIVNGERQQQYGHPSVHYARVADGWATIFADGIFTEDRIALAMAWFKICRQLQTNKRDNLIDAIGYLITADMCIEQKARLTEMVTAIEREPITWDKLENLGKYKSGNPIV